MRQRFRRLATIIVVAAFGALLGAALLAVLHPSMQNVMQPRAEWLGFWGSILGGLATVGAGYLAWSAAQDEMRFMRDAYLRDKEAEYAIAIVFCLQIERRCDAIRRAGAILLEDQQNRRIILHVDAIAALREVRNENIRERGIITAEDVNSIIYRLPVHTWQPLKELYGFSDQLNRIVGEMRVKEIYINPVRQLMIDADMEVPHIPERPPQTEVPIDRAAEAAAEIDRIRQCAIALKAELDIARGNL